MGMLLLLLDFIGGLRKSGRVRMSEIETFTAGLKNKLIKSESYLRQKNVAQIKGYFIFTPGP